MDIDLSLAIACYKDAPHLKKNVIFIRDLLAKTSWKVEYIFVEDAGNDGSREIIDELVKKEMEFEKTVFHEKNTGRGQSIQDAFEIAEGNVLGYIDIDLAVSPVYIPLMLHKLFNCNYDVANALRIYRTSFAFSSVTRDIFSYCYRLISRKLLKMPFYDTETGYKFFRREAYKKLAEYAKDPGWFWDTELMVYSHLLGLKVIEIPCLYQRDKNKATTVNIILDTIEYLRKLFRLRKKIKKL